MRESRGDDEPFHWVLHHAIRSGSVYLPKLAGGAMIEIVAAQPQPCLICKQMRTVFTPRGGINICTGCEIELRKLEPKQNPDPPT